MEKESQTIFEKNVIEFVTVAAEFCAFLERAEHMKRKAFVDTSLKYFPCSISKHPCFRSVKQSETRHPKRM